MFCSACGSAVPAGSRFCTACGAEAVLQAQAAAAVGQAQFSGSAAAAAAGSAMAMRAQAAAGKLLSDLRSLKFSALFPVKDWFAERPWTIGWIQALAFLAFYPVALGLICDSTGPQDLTAELKTSAWSLGLYFAVIWGAIFYRTVKPGHIDAK